MKKLSNSRVWLVLVSSALLGGATACGDGDGKRNSNAETDVMRENVDAMSREHADDIAEPSAAATPEPQREVIAETLPYAEIGDELGYGYFVFPADMVEPLPAVIVIHEWWGLNEGVRAMADRIAGEGYIVLAVDLFSGRTAAAPDTARELMLEVVENPEPANQNLRQAFEFLRTTAGAPRIASLGWCFGGGWALNTALLFPDELDAAVIYYGQVTDDEARLQPLNVPILGIFAEEDRGIPLASVRAFEDTLARLNKDYEIHVYPGVGHAFANPTGNNYDADAAAAAWSETLEFLDEQLALAAD